MWSREQWIAWADGIGAVWTWDRTTGLATYAGGKRTATASGVHAGIEEAMRASLAGTLHAKIMMSLD